MEILSRVDARAFGLTKYFSGKMCPFGHVTERWVHNAACCACNLMRASNAASQRMLERDKLRTERERLIHERKLANLALREADAAARAVTFKARAEERAKGTAAQFAEREETKRQRTLALIARNESTFPASQRSARRQWKLKQRGHLPPIPEQFWPPRPDQCEAGCGRGSSTGHRLEMDHDHYNEDPNHPGCGRCRGWLCNPCNRAIGACGDTRQAVKNIHEYMERVFDSWSDIEPWEILDSAPPQSLERLEPRKRTGLPVPEGRNQAIYEMRLTGATHDAIGIAFDLSGERVRSIIRAVANKQEPEDA